MRRYGLILAVCALALAAHLRDRFDAFIDATELPVLVHATSPEVRDRDGALLRAYTIDDGRWRLDVSLDRVDPRFIRMLIGYEDKRFYRHSGIDPIAMTRAFAQAIWHGRVVSGGSTLTMQVARLLEDSGTGAWRGKLRQMRLALALERRLTKDQILQIYLRIAPYGGNVEGIRAASLAWLGKEPDRLTPAEAALLVALPQAPESRRPDRHPDSAHIARDRVLARLARAGVVDKEDAQAALLDPSPRGRRDFPMLAPHLADRLVADGSGRVDTTLDARLQGQLQALALAHMQGRDPNLSLAILVADHQSGEILASVGSPDYSGNTARMGFVDMTTALRSPGSTLKPFVYALAFDRGLAHPETLIADTPVRFGTYAPQNFDGRTRGLVRVSEALQLSLNIPVVRLLDRLGPAHLVALMRNAGVTPEFEGSAPGLAVALGGVGLTLKDLVQLYAALAQDGRSTPLHVVAGQAGPRTQLVTPRAAWMAGHVLAGIVPPANAGPPGRVAFKTGTSYGHRDAWAIGFDGRYVVGIWTGRPDGTSVPGTFGAGAAAPLLFEVFGRVRPDPVPLPPPPADTLMVPNARLPAHLQRFDRADPDGDAPQLVFPPDGARLPDAGPLTVKLRHGAPPFTVLTNGAVVASGVRRGTISLPSPGPGFATVSVIDGQGRSAQVSVELR